LRVKKEKRVAYGAINKRDFCNVIKERNWQGEREPPETHLIN